MFILFTCSFVINADVWTLVLSNNRSNESTELIIIFLFLLYFPLPILHILLYSAIILLHFLLYFPIRTSGGAKKKMENSKSYYFRILLELAFLKGAKMAAELCKSRSYSFVFQKMTQIWNSCASLGMDLSVEHKASTWHLVYQQLSKAQVDHF